MKAADREIGGFVVSGASDGRGTASCAWKSSLNGTSKDDQRDDDHASPQYRRYQPGGDDAAYGTHAGFVRNQFLHDPSPIPILFY